MSIIEQNKSANMIRKHLDDFPYFAFSEKSSLRWFSPADVDLWVKLYAAADKYHKITPELFYREFGEDAAIWQQRISFMIDEDGKEVGTAAAWYNDDFNGESWGRIHWVAIVPEMQGRGLAKPMMSAVCRRFKSLGHDKVYLVTSTARIPAINLYRKFGFVPDVSTPEKKQVWEDFSAETGIDF